MLLSTSDVEEEREYNYDNLKKSQVWTLKRYKDLNTSNQRALKYLIIIKRKKWSSSSLPVSLRKHPKRKQKILLRLIYNKPED